ncbi:major facilitator superfamily domain-containing protein [Aspergillus heterothallicus]
MDKPDQLGYLAGQEDHELGKWDSMKKCPWTFVWCVFAVVALNSMVTAATVMRRAPSMVHLRPKVSAILPEQRAPTTAEATGPPLKADCHLLPKSWRNCGIPVTLPAAWFSKLTRRIHQTNEMFFGGKFLNGFALGALASVRVTYVGEISPLALRGTLTCLTAMAYCVGPFIVALITNTTGNYTTRWAYRAVSVAQYGYAGVALAFIFFMPESPWWLVSMNRQDKALSSLRRLGYSDSEATKKLASITTTLEQVRAETEGATYIDYSTYYMQLAGYSNSMSFRVQIAQRVVSIVGNAMSYFMIDRLGRRSLMLLGLFVMNCILMITGGLGVVDSDKTNPNADGAVKGTVALILLFCWWFNSTIGAADYTILAEVSTSRLRVKTIAIGLTLQNALYTMWSFVLPYLFNPDKANLGAKVTFIFGGLSVICLVYLWFYQPETAGRTYGELDEMFMKKVPPRKFKAYRTDAQAMGMAVKEGREEREV